MPSTEELYELLEAIGLPVTKISGDRHYWFIRTQGGSYFDEFFLDEFVGIGHEDVPCMPEDKRTDQLIDQVKERHPQATRVLNQVYKFCKEIHVGDVVIIPSASSAMFAFGYILDEQIYTVEVSQEDIEDGKCPFTRRRKTHWISGVPKSRVDSKLYTFFRNQQTLSQVDEYSEFIDRAIHPFYIKDGIAHLTLSILTPKSPNALDIPLYTYGIFARAKTLSEELGFSKDVLEIQSRTNVQSEGLIELFGKIPDILCVAVILLSLVGGRIKITFTKNKVHVDLKTKGLISAIVKILDRYKNDPVISEKTLLDAQSRLRIEDPCRQKDKEQP